MDMNDPAVRRTLARLRWQFRDMKREGRLVLQGRKPFTNSAQTNVAKTFRAYDWTPPSQMRGE